VNRPTQTGGRMCAGGGLGLPLQAGPKAEGQIGASLE
jgi:hypothetical protein